MPIRVVLADDHLIVRQGLRLLLENAGIEVAGEATDGQEAIDLIASLLPDVAVLELQLPGRGGLDVLAEIPGISPETRALVLTRLIDERCAIDALRMGARGYLLKIQASDDVIAAVNHVYRGEVYLNPRISRVVVDAYLAGTELPAHALSSRERQVLQLIGEGHSTKEIAALLGISFRTADSHRTRLMEKLDIHQTAGLVRYAIRSGYVER